MNTTRIDFSKMEWRPAIYNGVAIKGMLVSNYGFFRRFNRKTGGYGQVSRGTPSYNKQSKNRLRMFMVSCSFDDVLPGRGCSRTTLNIDRITCSTFLGTFWYKGMDVDHLDHNVANGFVGSEEYDYKNGNLRPCTHAENMQNMPIRAPRKPDSVAAQYAYKMKLQLNIMRTSDLPIAYRREYWRLAHAEKHGLPAIPRAITLHIQEQKPGRKQKA